VILSTVEAKAQAAALAVKETLIAQVDIAKVACIVGVRAVAFHTTCKALLLQKVYARFQALVCFALAR
jgi:hypothetical protein